MKEKEISEFNLSLNRLSQKIKPFVKQIATFWQIFTRKNIVTSEAAITRINFSVSKPTKPLNLITYHLSDTLRQKYKLYSTFLLDYGSLYKRNGSYQRKLIFLIKKTSYLGIHKNLFTFF